MKVVTSDEMRRIEREEDAAGLTLSALMLRAGEAVAHAVAEAGGRGTVLVLAGPGNNGGDGLIAARRLSEMGKRLLVYGFRRESAPDGLDFTAANEDPAGETLQRWLLDADVVVDALLGIGQQRAVEGELRAIVEATNTRRRDGSSVIAVDIPTGVDADTGRVLGTAIRAERTICMGFLKPGLILYPGAEFAGDVVLRPLGMSASRANRSQICRPGASDIARLLPKRSQASNKGTFGRVLVVAGSADFMGAPAMVTLAAYRAGAGLVEVLVPDAVQTSVASHVMECIFATGRRPGPYLTSECMPQIAEASDHAKSLVVGPGMGQNDSTRELMEEFLRRRREREVGTVIDADGLNNLSKIDRWWEGQSCAVLTPHPGEMSRLTGLSIDEIQSRRLECARQHAQTWSQVVVLKGAGTVVAAPDGRVSINPTGGPNLATAGTGDVLSGIIGGLLAQGCSPFDAAVAGTYLHGRAGDMLAASHGDSGTLAGDLTGMIPLARRQTLEESGGK